MGLSWAGWLPLLRLSVPEILAPEPVWGPLSQVAGMWPVDCLAAFEVRLGPGSHPVDLSIRCSEPHHARAALAAPVGSARALFRRWAEGEGHANRRKALWLEFDLDAACGDELPEPSMCARVGVDRDPAWMIDELLPQLRGVATAAEERAELRRCLAAIPPGIDLLYVSCMRSRPGAPVRLELGASGAGPLLACLRGLVPPGGPVERSLERLERAAPLFDGVDRCLTAFDLLPELQPRLSLAGRFRRLPRREPGWSRLFERLAAAGLSDPAKGEAALALSGWDSPRTAPALWPRTGTGEPVGGSFARALSHVKLVAQPGRSLEGKVYLNASLVSKTGSRKTT